MLSHPLPALLAASTLTKISRGMFDDTFAGIQEATSVMPDYAFKDSDSVAGTSVAGVVGSAVTMLLAGGVGILISKAKRKSA